MTRLERAKWLKRAKKELVKRFGGSFDGDADSEKVIILRETMLQRITKSEKKLKEIKSLNKAYQIGKIHCSSS